MSDLCPIEKIQLENLLGMSTGFVLDFSNREFSEFFQSTIDIDIFDAKYAYGSSSKANRMRSFWQNEDNEKVGKLLKKLIECWKVKKSLKNEAISQAMQNCYQSCLGIIDRLLVNLKNHKIILQKNTPTTNKLEPWTFGPFELLLHAEDHYTKGNDFDRRISLISFDNCIEICITTYLTLHPTQRGSREYRKEDIKKHLDNFHTKIDFFYQEIKRRGIDEKHPKSSIIWLHDHRNEQYHNGKTSVPNLHDLNLIREIAIWIFSILYEKQQVDDLLSEELIKRNGKPVLPRDLKVDRIIDKQYGLIQLGGQSYYASEILYAVDPIAYREFSLDLESNDEY